MTEHRAVKLGNFKTETVEPSRWATENTSLCVVLSAFKIVIRIPLTVCHICQVEQRLNTFKARGGEVGQLECGSEPPLLLWFCSAGS